MTEQPASIPMTTSGYIPISAAQRRRIEELSRRVSAAQVAFDEFGAYMAEEAGIRGQPDWILDMKMGAWVKRQPPTKE